MPVSGQSQYVDDVQAAQLSGHTFAILQDSSIPEQALASDSSAQLALCPEIVNPVSLAMASLPSHVSVSRRRRR